MLGKLRQLFSSREFKAELTQPELKDAWLRGFGEGYGAAWQTMLPLMTAGVQKSQEAIKQAAWSTAISTVELAIEQRVTERINDINKVRTYQALSSKRTEFTRKRQQAAPSDQARYDHYLEALGWALDGHSTTA